MLSITGLNKFKEFFTAFKDHYVLIGGTACAIIFDDIGSTFRATKDFDMVLIIENLDDSFIQQFWDFIKVAGYSIESNEKKPTFYRFKNPINKEYPKMIELFSRSKNLQLPSDSHLIPIHISDEVSSLSAILLNNDYYTFLMNGRRIINDIVVLDEIHLIPFKTKAWCELIERRKVGESGQSRHIKKHCKDIAHLVSLIPKNMKLQLTGAIKKDMENFLSDLLISDYVPQDIDRNQLYQDLSEIYF